MSHKIKVNVLNRTSIQNAIKEIEEYQIKLVYACKTFVQRLSDEGIIVAQQNVGGYGKYITFTTELESVTDGYKAVMVATNTGFIRSTWVTLEGEQEAYVNPLLMVEFGSGSKAQNPKNIDGVGRGTFGKGNGLKEGWWYMDTDNVWHYQTGVAPQQPMLKASAYMFSEINRIGKEVFSRL